MIWGFQHIIQVYIFSALLFLALPVPSLISHSGVYVVVVLSHNGTDKAQCTAMGRPESENV